MGSGSVEGILGRIDVENKVDTSCGECVHARVVVCGVVNSINTDGVDTQLLELRDVPTATALIRNGVSEIRAATRLIVNATNVEAVTSLEEGCSILSDNTVCGEFGYHYITNHCP